MSNLINIAKEVFEIESKEIANLSNLLTKDFEDAINIIHSSRGKLIISGMGKSGIVGQKIAATLASTGTPSFFMHPAEAYHGDLGMIEKEDIVLLISNSGETDEILKLIPFLQHQENIVISMSNNPKSTLAKNTHYHINIAVQKEACPLSLAPTSSTTATMVMGDAMAVALMKLNNFKSENFAQFHPGGNLGKKLVTTVASVMIKNNLPSCNKGVSIKEVIHKITDGKCGLVVVVDEGAVVGIITDGDIRRFMNSHEGTFFALKVDEVMTKKPKTIRSNKKLIEAGDIMRENNIHALVVDDGVGSMVGIVQMHHIANIAV